jgi:hypothetical protein
MKDRFLKFVVYMPYVIIIIVILLAAYGLKDLIPSIGKKIANDPYPYTYTTPDKVNSNTKYRSVNLDELIDQIDDHVDYLEHINSICEKP